ncbi:uncharacterized protein LOC122258315 [Penaeus japonicus]|uniref:uncharacterized protein LOC122258315 n=1 Tax=Penaeus japonicus TaxID=27405 RepID=UPI001C70D45C|nr:uncharacterized protein LOC122258315 [Penaeus japonicus]
MQAAITGRKGLGSPADSKLDEKDGSREKKDICEENGAEALEQGAESHGQGVESYVQGVESYIQGVESLEQRAESLEQEVDLLEQGVESLKVRVEIKEKGVELQDKRKESIVKEKEMNPMEERLESCKNKLNSSEEGMESIEKEVKPPEERSESCKKELNLPDEGMAPKAHDETEPLLKGVEWQKKMNESPERRAELPGNEVESTENGMRVPGTETLSQDKETKRRDEGLRPKGDEADRYYVLGQQMNVEEDLCHEFKGHRSISIHDIHNLCLNSNGTTDRTRNAVSIAISAMLNSGHGGTIYLGVSDDGLVKGVGLTRYQRDHVEVSLRWTLSKYTPPVPESRYYVNFVPVASSKTTQGSFKLQEERVDEQRRRQAHHVAQPNYCWCDMDASALRALGRLPLLFVVEVHIRPWNPHNHPSSVERNPLYPEAPPLPPLHLTEAGGLYVRQSCRQPRFCLEDVRRLEVHRVREHYTLKAMALQTRYQALRDLALQHGVNLPA